MILRRIGALSFGKVLGALYAPLGFIIGGIYALVALLFAVIGVSTALESGDALAGGTFGVLYGVGSVILFPILYGVLGFVGGLISALLYNLIARFLGGIDLELGQSSSRVYEERRGERGRKPPLPRDLSRAGMVDELLAVDEGVVGAGSAVHVVYGVVADVALVVRRQRHPRRQREE